MRAPAVLAAALATVTTVASPALAQPGPGKPAGDKVDAKSLLASGLKLFTAKDYLGALAVFKDAYARFPSAKILLNIGTTQKALGRHADAANTYQRYLDSSEADPAKKKDVQKVLAELDAKVGIVEIAVTPDGAEVQIADEDWQPAAQVVRYRVMPGKVAIRARREGYTPAEKSLDVAVGMEGSVRLDLAEIPAPKVEVVTTTGGDAGGGAGGQGIAQTVTRREPLSRFGAFAHALVDVANKGGAARVGGSIELIPRVTAELAALIGPKSGGHVGARYAILGGTFRPMIAIGMPVFISDGPRFSVRGAAGLELALHRRLSLVAEVGVERVLNAEMNIVETVLVPAIGAAGRL